MMSLIFTKLFYLTKQKLLIAMKQNVKQIKMLRVNIFIKFFLFD